MRAHCRRGGEWAKMMLKPSKSGDFWRPDRLRSAIWSLQRGPTQCALGQLKGLSSVASIHHARWIVCSSRLSVLSGVHLHAGRCPALGRLRGCRLLRSSLREAVISSDCISEGLPSRIAGCSHLVRVSPRCTFRSDHGFLSPIASTVGLPRCRLCSSAPCPPLFELPCTCCLPLKHQYAYGPHLCRCIACCPSHARAHAPGLRIILHRFQHGCVPCMSLPHIMRTSAPYPHVSAQSIGVRVCCVSEPMLT